MDTKQLLAYIGFLLLSGTALLIAPACETPSSPSFETEQSYRIGLINDKRYRLLGGNSGAIIDTTAEHFRDRFTTDPDSDLVLLGFEADFPFGDVSAILPDVTIEPLEVASEVPQLLPEIDAEPEVEFETITGQSPADFPAGVPLSGGTAGPIDSDLEIARLVEAEVVQGGLRVTLTNNLGFDLDRVSFRLVSDGVVLGEELEAINLTDGEVFTDEARLSEGDLLRRPLEVRTTFEWSDQQMSRNAGWFGLNSENTDDLEVSRALGTFPSREAARFYETQIQQELFTFTSPEDFVDIAEGQFTFADIINDIDLDFDTLTFSFPNIYELDESGNYSPGDTLSFQIFGEDRIRRSSHPSNIDGRTFSYEVEGLRIFAPDNIINVTVVGVTEETEEAPPGERIREVFFDQTLTARVEDIQANATQASGFFNPRFYVLRNEEENGGEGDEEEDILDLMNEADRQRISFEELEFSSLSIDDLALVNASMDINYTTNINIENRAYMALMGRNEDGAEFFLRGKPGTEFSVAEDDSISGLFYNGQPVANQNLFTATIKRKDDLGSGSGNIRISGENSNLDSFISQLPTEVYSITKALVNPQERTGSAALPVDISADMRLNVPFQLQSDGQPTRIADTLSVSLSELPAPEDEFFIESGRITVDYSNRIPLNIGLRLGFLDAQQEPITELPLSADEDIRIFPAPVNAAGFSEAPRRSTVSIDLSTAQLRELSRTRSLLLNAEVLTEDDKTVGIRASDMVGLSIRGDFEVRLRVD